MDYLNQMRNEPAGWLSDILEWLRTNVVVFTALIVGWSILDRRIKKISAKEIMQNIPIEELEDEVKLPRWFLRAQLISKPLSLGFVGVIAFIMFFPGIKPTLAAIKIPLSGTDYVSIYDGLLIVLIIFAIPFIIFAGNKIDISQYIKKT